MKEILLTQGQVALVDDEDFEELNQFKWHACRSRQTYYALRYHRVLMHHQIIGKPPIGLVTDHKDRNGLHNWKDNLRFITNRENLQNTSRVSKTSKYPGVSWHKVSRKWIVHAHLNGKIRHLGLFTNEEKAAKTYLKAVEEIESGNFCYLY